MSIDAIEYGVQAETEVRTWYRVRCDDSPSGFLMVSKTPPSGANAMTVTIKPLYGEPFTVNADLLRSAMDLALHDRPVAFEEAVQRRMWTRQKVEQLQPGDRVKVLYRGRADRPRLATVESVESYSVNVLFDREHEEEKDRFLHYEAANSDVVEVYDRLSDESR